MSRFSFHGLSVRRRLFVMTVLPLFIITALLTTYMVVTRQSDREEVLADRGNSMVRYLAGAAEFGLFAGDNAGLRRLAATMLQQEDVRVVSFFDSQGKLLLSTGDPKIWGRLFESAPEALLLEEDFNWIFQLPVYYSTLEVDEFEVAEQSVSQAPLLGWVQLVMDERRMRTEQQAILVTSLLLGSVGFLGLFLLAGYVARGISRPISTLTHTVKQLEAGELSSRALVEAGGELGELAQGINSLAESVEISSEDLNARVADATKRLTGTLETLEHRNEQLEEARQELIKASAAKGEFLARMSHELRTPLTAVSGYAKLLQTMTHNESQEEYLKSITSASAILLSTIDDILDFTRLEAGVVALEEIPFHLEEALEDVLAMHALTAHQKQLELVLLVAPDVPAYVIGDPLRLRQVVTNLISNAVKFTDSGQVVLSANLLQLGAERVVLKFDVKDSGVGISAEHQAQLFDAFSQADSTIRRRFGGTGLGLAIAKELTRLMEGDIRISSRLGEGTQVDFTIRCGIAQSPPEQQTRAEADAGMRASRLFIYDRNPWVRRSLRSVAMMASDSISVSAGQQQLILNIEASGSEKDVVLAGLSAEELEPARLEGFLSKLRESFKGTAVLLAGIDIAEVNELEDECARFGPLYVRSKPIRKDKLLNVLQLAQSFKEGRLQRLEAPFQLDKLPGSDRLNGVRVLVAEDNEFNRNLICAVVEAEGGEAIPAVDGVQALRELHAQSIDLVLMDLNMPRLDGRLALQELRLSDGVVARLPVIALTAEVLDGDDQELLGMGFNRILFKPLDEEFLINTIVELLDRADKPKEKGRGSGQSFLSALPKGVLAEEIQRQLNLLRAAQRDNDLQQLRNQAHQLRSVLYGMSESDTVVACVRALEQACDRSQGSDEVKETFCRLEEKLSQSLGVGKPGQSRD
ncbi:MAG: ATP-binding protein [Pseudomonadales bacterium]